MPWEERIGQRDVRHLPADLSVVLLANCLDRGPDILRRDDDGGSLVVQALHAEHSAWQGKLRLLQVWDILPGHEQADRPALARNPFDETAFFQSDDHLMHGRR